MTVNRGGFRRTSTYKVSEDTALVAGMIEDITGSACTLYNISVVAGGADSWLKLYDDAAPVLGTAVPVFAIYCKASVTTTMYIPEGIPFTNSLSIAATGTSGDASETGAVASINCTFITT